MDSSFNFPKLTAEIQEKPSQNISHCMDLRGTPCPINYVKVKLKLEDLNSGDLLEVLLDEGEPIQNVPKSLEDDGHQIASKERQNGFFKVVVKKQ
jgi:TusA-related sulfurtransferase